MYVRRSHGCCPSRSAHRNEPLTVVLPRPQELFKLSRGPIVLSWGDVVRGINNPGDGFNVVLHEFAHKLDEQYDGVDGMPELTDAGHFDEWVRVLTQEFEALEARVDDGSNPVLDDYALTSPPEFFAVATESFFEKPRSMQKRLPDLYEQLKRFYRIDPASWHRDG